VAVDRAAIVGAELVAGNREIRPQLDQRQNSPPQRHHPRPVRRRDVFGAAQVGRRMLPTTGAGEVDEAARGERAAEALTRLLVKQPPIAVRKLSVPAQQVVHRSSALRLPIRNDPSPPPGAPTSAAPPPSGGASPPSPISSLAASAASPFSTI